MVSDNGDIDSDDAPLINPDDFKSMKFNIKLINRVTEAQFQNGRMYFGDIQGRNFEEDQKINFNELLEEGMVLEIPWRLCAEGHLLDIKIEPVNCPPGTQPFEAVLKVDSLEKMEKGRAKITASLHKCIPDDWKNFCSIFTHRQSQIEDFFDAVKGR